MDWRSRLFRLWFSKRSINQLSGHRLLLGLGVTIWAEWYLAGVYRDIQDLNAEIADLRMEQASRYRDLNAIRPTPEEWDVLEGYRARQAAY
jgi:hypothetical protein